MAEIGYNIYVHSQKCRTNCVPCTISGLREPHCKICSELSVSQSVCDNEKLQSLLVRCCNGRKTVDGLKTKTQGQRIRIRYCLSLSLCILPPLKNLVPTLLTVQPVWSDITGRILSDYMELSLEPQKALYYFFAYVIVHHKSWWSSPLTEFFDY